MTAACPTGLPTAATEAEAVAWREQEADRDRGHVRWYVARCGACDGWHLRRDEGLR